MDNSSVYIDTLADKYMIKRTINLDQIYNTLEDTRQEQTKINKKHGTGWGLVAQVPAEEFAYNKDLQLMLWYEETGQKAEAKAVLRKYLSENPRFKMANV